MKMRYSPDMGKVVFRNLKELTDIIDLSVRLSENGGRDLDNIHRIGEGWVAEETLGIAIYCSLRHQNDFLAGVIAAVNHKGDSDSAGAVTGNILGALLGYGRIDEKWKPIWNSQMSSWKWRTTCVMDDKCMNTAIMRIRLGLESI